MDDKEIAELKAAGIIGKSVQGVYMFNNPETEQHYIGSTNSMSSRLSAHVGQLKRGVHPNYKFQKAYNANPNFQFVPVPIQNLDMDEILRIEDSLIKRSAGHPGLLNIAMDVERPRLGVSPSQETRAKISESQKRLYESGYVNPMQGRKQTPETLAKMSDNARRQFEANPTLREAVSQRTVAQFQDPEYRAMHRQATVEAMNDPEVKAKIAQGGINFWKNPENREKLTALNAERNNRPEVKEAFVERTAKAWEDPAFRAKQVKNVSICGVVYESLSEASRQLGVALSTMHVRINSSSEKYRDWFYT